MNRNLKKYTDYKEMSFKEKVVRTFKGIGSPKTSGDYKFAKLQIELSSGAVLAFVIPIICIGILLSITPKMIEKPMTTPVYLDKVENVNLEEPEPPAVDKSIEFDFQDTDFDGSGTHGNPSDTIDTSDFSDKPLTPKASVANSVAIIKSPIIMNEILGLRRAGQKGDLNNGTDGFGRDVKGGEATLLRALRWLKSQQLSDGSWSGQPTAMTGLALLTFLAHGETPSPECEEFGSTVEKGIRYLVDSQTENGLFRSKDGNNYAHPIATYALCEAYTLTKVPMLKTAAEKALIHIVNGQHPSGGWDYNMKQSERDDTSYMGWCAQAIKAGQVAVEFGGLDVANLNEACSNAVNGFKTNADKSGGFGYTSPAKSGLSGVGVLCMQLLGASGDKEVSNGLAFLDECTYSFDHWDRQPYGGSSPVYYWYYITQAKFHTGGDRWRGWNKQFQPELIKCQTIIKGAYRGLDGSMRDVGYWDSPSASEHGQGVEGKRIQDTALCALQLMVYYRNLPTFRRVEVDSVDSGDLKDSPIDDIRIKVIR